MITKTLENGHSKWQIVAIVNLFVSIIIFSFAVYKVTTLERKAAVDVTDATLTCLPAMLPYGSEAEDPSQETITVSLQNYKLFGHDISSGEMEVSILGGYVNVDSVGNKKEVFIKVASCNSMYDEPDPTQQQFFFQRELTADEKAKVACLISVDDVVFGHVSSWISLVCNDISGGIFQMIFAIAADTNVYVLRSWNNNVPDNNAYQFSISIDDVDGYKVFDTNLTASDVAGKMIIESFGVQYDIDILPLTPD